MKNYFLITLFTIINSFYFYAQDPQIEWQNTIGGNSEDYLYAMAKSVDGGYLLGGTSYSDSSGDKSENSLGDFDYWVVKINSLGEIEWENTIGGNKAETLWSVAQTSDGGFILGGTSESDISGDKTEPSAGRDYWVVKLDVLGNIAWQNTIGGDYSDNIFSIKQTTDGGYILGGSSNSNISGEKTQDSKGIEDFWIVKLSNTGTVEWDKTVGGNNMDILQAIIQSSDGGYVVGGYSESEISGDKSENPIGFTDYWVVKLSATGEVEWENTIGGTGYESIYSIAETAEGGYILVGPSTSNISGDKSEDALGTDYWIVKINLSGQVEWDRTFGGEGADSAYSIQTAANNSFYILGSSNSDICDDKTENSLGERDYWVLLINQFGNITWQNTIGGDNMDIGFPMLYENGSLLIGGHSRSNISGDKTENSNGERDFWVIKINPVLGVNDNELTSSLSIYPNPTENILQLNHKNHTIDGLKIFDTKGSLIKEFTSPKNTSSINISDLSSGVYFLQISSEGKTVIKKFVKR
ncbi:MAG: T9SS type A sorting domain-containing protein [Aequorivita sp.]|nr:T9SS type A sorting domain-containing protein [Aequorivita sp.]